MPEILVVTILILSVAAMVTLNVVKADRAADNITDATWNQSALNDAATRMTRDIATANPILFTRTTDGWPSNSPSRTDLWVQYDTGMTATGECVRARYYVAPGGQPKTWVLKSDTYKFATSGCPDPRLGPTAVAHPTKVTTTIVEDLTTGEPDAIADGTTAPKVFDYLNRANTSLLGTADILPNKAAVSAVARVKISMGAESEGRDNGLRMQTSVAPRSIADPNLTSIPLPDCAQANLRATMDSSPGNPQAPVVSWSKTDYADFFTLSRTISGTNASYASHLGDTPLRDDTVARTSTRTFTDEALRGHWGINIDYALTISGPGGIVTCLMPTGNRPNVPDNIFLDVPSLTATVTPGSLSPASSTGSTAVALSWTTPAHVTSFSLVTMPASATTGAVTGLGTSQDLTATTSAKTVSLHNAGAWKVVAHSAAYKPAVHSTDSNTQVVVAHADRPNVSSSISANGSYNLSWSAPSGSNATAWAIYYTTNDGASWTHETNVGAGTTSRSSTACTSAATRCKYAVAAINTGPRGSTAPAGTQWVGNSTVASTDALRYQRSYRLYKYRMFRPLFRVQEFRYVAKSVYGCWFPPGDERADAWPEGSNKGWNTARWVPVGANGRLTRDYDLACNGTTAEYDLRPAYTPWSDRGQCPTPNGPSQEKRCTVGGEDHKYDPRSFSSPNWEFAPGSVSDWDFNGGTYESTHIPTGGPTGGGRYDAEVPDDFKREPKPGWNGNHRENTYDDYASMRDVAEAVYSWGTTAPGAGEDGGVYYTWDRG